MVAFMPGWVSPRHRPTKLHGGVKGKAKRRAASKRSAKARKANR